MDTLVITNEFHLYEQDFWKNLDENMRYVDLQDNNIDYCDALRIIKLSKLAPNVKGLNFSNNKGIGQHLSNIYSYVWMDYHDLNEFVEELESFYSNDNLLTINLSNCCISYIIKNYINSYRDKYPNSSNIIITENIIENGA